MQRLVIILAIAVTAVTVGAVIWILATPPPVPRITSGARPATNAPTLNDLLDTETFAAPPSNSSAGQTQSSPSVAVSVALALQPANKASVDISGYGGRALNLRVRDTLRKITVRRVQARPFNSALAVPSCAVDQAAIWIGPGYSVAEAGDFPNNIAGGLTSRSRGLFVIHQSLLSWFLDQEILP